MIRAAVHAQPCASVAAFGKVYHYFRVAEPIGQLPQFALNRRLTGTTA